MVSICGQVDTQAVAVITGCHLRVRQAKGPKEPFCDCQLKGVKDPQLIMVDKLKTKFLVCKQNLELLEKHGPYFRLKFLKGPVSKAKTKGDSVHASRIIGIIQKEATQKQWQRINKSTSRV